MKHTIDLNGYRFPPLNTYISKHWSKGHKLKREAKLMIMSYAVHVPKAERKRRVDIHVTLSGRQKITDDDSLWKACLDGLKGNLLLVDDSPKWCEMGKVTHDRGEKTQTVVVLTDLYTA